MSVYAKKLNKKWRKAFKEYEKISGFEPMFQEDIDSGCMEPEEAWNANLEWLEDMLAEVVNIKIPVNF